MAGRPAPSPWRTRARELLAFAEVVVLLALRLNIISLGTGLVTAWAAVGILLVLVVTLRVMHLDGDLRVLSAPRDTRRSRPERRRTASGRAQSA